MDLCWNHPTSNCVHFQPPIDEAYHHHGNIPQLLTPGAAQLEGTLSGGVGGSLLLETSRATAGIAVAVEPLR